MGEDDNIYGDPIRPGLVLEHGRSRNMDGTALNMSITPATDSRDGYVTLIIAKQPETNGNTILTKDEFDWPNGLSACLGAGDIAKVDCVILGYQERLDAGRGISAHDRSGRGVVLHFDHKFDNRDGHLYYEMSIEDGKNRLAFPVTLPEAHLLNRLIEHAIAKICFG